MFTVLSSSSEIVSYQSKRKQKLTNSSLSSDKIRDETWVVDFIEEGMQVGFTDITYTQKL